MPRGAQHANQSRFVSSRYPVSVRRNRTPLPIVASSSMPTRQNVGTQFTSLVPLPPSSPVGCGATENSLFSLRRQSSCHPISCSSFPRGGGGFGGRSVGYPPRGRATISVETPLLIPKPKRTPEPVKPVIDPYFRLCPYAMLGQCRFGDKCMFVHGVLCDLCGVLCLDPFNPQQRKFHQQECVQRHEQDMKLSFQHANSADKICGICYDVVLNKEGNKCERRFGILPSCSHVFCLACIRQWRQQKPSIVNRLTTRTCPACRKPADFIIPSKFWVDEPEDKEEMIKKYKDNMQKKHCKYFARGAKNCPFGNKCFYKHELRDGTIVDLGPPKKRIKEKVEEQALFQQLLMWDLMDQRELRTAYMLELHMLRSLQHSLEDDYDSDLEYQDWDSTFDDLDEYLAYEQDILGNRV